MPRMTEAQVKKLTIDERYSMTERTPLAKSLIKAAATELEDTLAAQIEAHGLPTPVRQWEFHNSAVAWRWDFAWPAYKLLVEVNGGVYQGAPTGHRSIRGVVRDYAKLNAASARHWWTMVFESKAVESGDAVLAIEQFILTFDELSKKDDPC